MIIVRTLDRFVEELGRELRAAAALAASPDGVAIFSAQSIGPYVAGMLQRASAVTEAALRTDDRLLDVDDWSDDELRVVRLLVDRVNSGRTSYGFLELVSDKRDFRREGSMERIDALFYDLCAELQGADEAKS